MKKALLGTTALIAAGLAVGDAYAAGFLYGLMVRDMETGVRYGAAFSALKQTSWSDFCWSTGDEVEALIAGSNLRIAR